MKKVFLACIILSSLLAFGCNFGKPAYSDIQVDNKTKGDPQRGESGGSANANQAANPAGDPIANAEKEAGLTGAQQNAAPENKERQPPNFFVPGSTEMKDLPKYKRSQIVNVQYGPVSGVSSAMLIYQSPDSVDKIGAFYEGSFKSNGWEIVTNIKDPENFEYTLQKGKTNEALVRIKKDTQTGTTMIMVSRAEVPPGQSVTSTPLPPAPQNPKK
jgi:hypothetical protein